MFYFIFFNNTSIPQYTFNPALIACLATEDPTQPLPPIMQIILVDISNIFYFLIKNFFLLFFKKRKKINKEIFLYNNNNNKKLL